MSTFFGIEDPISDSKPPREHLLCQYQWNYQSLSKNVKRSPISLKLGNPVTPARCDNITETTTLKLVTHTFDNDDNLVPFKIRYILSYTTGSSSGPSECNLADIDLSMTPSSSLTIGTPLTPCTSYLLDERIVLSDHVADFANLATFVVLVQQQDGGVFGNENCLDVMLMDTV